jgi:hypothetical protein
MPQVTPFHSAFENYKPGANRVHHNNSACGLGRKVQQPDRRNGTGDHRLCHDCAELNRHGQ